jgi:predicted dehydrogenase
LTIFAQCVLDDANPVKPGEEGLRDVKIITSIYEAAKSGTAVKLA